MRAAPILSADPRAKRSVLGDRPPGDGDHRGLSNESRLVRSIEELAHDAAGLESVGSLELAKPLAFLGRQLDVQVGGPRRSHVRRTVNTIAALVKDALDEWARLEAKLPQERPEFSWRLR